MIRAPFRIEMLIVRKRAAASIDLKLCLKIKRCSKSTNSFIIGHYLNCSKTCKTGSSLQRIRTFSAKLTKVNARLKRGIRSRQRCPRFVKAWAPLGRVSPVEILPHYRGQLPRGSRRTPRLTPIYRAGRLKRPPSIWNKN